MVVVKKSNDTRTNISTVMFKLVFTIFIFAVPSKILSQVKMAPSPRTVKAKFEDMHTKVVQPETGLLEAFMTSPDATINVTYVGFASFPDAQTAFQFAVDIWASQIASDVPIEVIATFEPLATNVLGSAGPNYIVRDFPGAPLSNTFYPAALANSLAGFDIFTGPDDHDINASFNSDFSNWYFGTDGNTPSGEFDFVSVVLHELGHGLGFTGSASVSGPQGSIGFPPRIYDLFVENGAGTSIQDFSNPSVALGNQLESDDLFMGGTNVVASNGGNPAKLYAPDPFESGSSFSHWDEDGFPAGNPNSLMTPAIGTAEAIHDPGDLTRALFDDIGWSGGSQIGVPLQLTNMNSLVLIDFDNTVADVNSDQFSGSGFDPTPSGGQLDADSWSLMGMSDGDLDFSASGTTGDYARGVSSSGVSTGGVYAFEAAANNRTLGFQPTGTDFTPGEVVLKMQNSSGMDLTSLQLSYLVYVYNDQNRSSSFSFSFSDDNSTYTTVPGLDLTTVQAADGSPTWEPNSKSTLLDLTGSPIGNGSFLFLKWSSNDVSGTGSRDQIGLDDIGILPNPCTIPTNLQSSGETANSANITWSQILSALSYEIRYRVVGGSGWTTLTSQTNSLPLSNLESGTEYQWMVKAICATGGSIESNFSSKSKFSTTGTPACPVPINLMDASVSDTQQNLDWDDVTEADHYQVQYRVKGTSGWTTITTGTNSISPLAPLSAGTRYQWKVRSVCSANGSLVSDYTAKQEFTTTGSTACPIPSNLLDASASDTQQNLNWDDVTEADHYQVQYRVKGSSRWTTMTTGTGTSSISLTPLSVGTTYQWKARSVCTADGSLVSDYTAKQEFTTTGSSACPIPSNLSDASASDTQQNLDWDDVTEADHYQVKYKVKGSSGWTTVTTGTSSISPLSPLSTGTTYQWKARSVCTADGSLVSDYTAKQEFTTTGTAACPTPGSLSTSAITENSANISWAAASGALDYQIQYKIVGTPAWTTITNRGNHLSHPLEPESIHKLPLESEINMCR